MKVATFNANSLRSRLEVVQRWLKDNQPDVLAIQETKVQDAHFPLEAFDGSGYHIVYRGQKAYNGVALLSKITPVDVVSHLEQDAADQARFLKARFGTVTVLNTYVPQGMDIKSEKFDYKLKWLGWLRTYLDRHHDPNESLIWVGDFNVARLAIDVHDPERLWGHVCFCEAVQNALENVMAWGFSDVFREFNPEPGQYTFWDYRVPNALKRNLGWRLDYIMATSPLLNACRKCWIDTAPRGWSKPSDHTFLIADFAVG